MRFFNFTRLVNKYKSEFTAITLKTGYYDDSGDWVNAETEDITLSGAVIKHRSNKIYTSNGTLSAKDRALFMLSPIDKALLGTQVVFEDDEGKNVYSIESNLENAKFTGVYAYTLKYVSAFKERLQGDLTEENERFGKRLDGVTE